MSIFKLNLITFCILLFCKDVYSQAHLVDAETIYEAGNIIDENEKHEGSILLNSSFSKGNRAMMSGPVLHDQSELVNYPGMGFGGANVSGTTGEFLGVAVNLDNNRILADDIIVPPGEKWIIDSIAIFNYETNSGTSSTINDVRMQIRQGNTPGSGTIVFGDLTTNRLDTTYFTGIYRTLKTSKLNTQRPIMRSVIATNALTLTSAYYMIEHTVGGNLALAGPLSPLRTIGTTHIATGNAFQFTSSWINVIELDENGDNPQPKGLAMIVYGISMEDKAAEVNGVNYNTLQEAIDAAVNDGDEITLLKNINESTVNVGLNSKSVIIKSDGYSCTINQLNISNGEYLRWFENNLTITGSINNNTSGMLWNNADVTISNFTNTGIYKGDGTLFGNINNQNIFAPGN